MPSGTLMVWTLAGNVALIDDAFTVASTPNGSLRTASITTAQLADFYNPDSTPTQTTIWFRMNMDNRVTGVNRYEYDISNAKLTVVPEPRVYAALLGMLALGLVVAHRGTKKRIQ